MTHKFEQMKVLKIKMIDMLVLVCILKRHMLVIISECLYVMYH